MSKGWFEAEVKEDGSIVFQIWDGATVEDKANLDKLITLFIKRGVDGERERIIKLLEAKKTNDGKTIFLEVDGLIALIKGEK